MPPQQYQRDKTGIRLDLGGGINTMLPSDLLVPPNPLTPSATATAAGYPYLQNVRRNLQGRAVSRPALGNGVFSGSINPPTSLIRMNDATPLGPAYGYMLIMGGGALMYVWDGNPQHAPIQVASGLSGKPLSFVTFRPNASPQPWCYVADPSQQITILGPPPPVQTAPVPGAMGMGMVKVAWDGIHNGPIIYKAGIVEPQIAPQVKLLGPSGPGISWVMYRYVYRGSATGAVSNPSPESQPIQMPQTSAGPITLYPIGPPSASAQPPPAMLLNFNYNTSQYDLMPANPGGSPPSTKPYLRTNGGVQTGTLTDYIQIYNWGLNIPANVTIQGVEVGMNWLANGVSSTGVVANITLYYQGIPIGTVKSPGTSNVSSVAYTPLNPGPGGLSTFGTNSDDWEASLTPDIVNDQTFGFGVQILTTESTDGSNRSFLYWFQLTVYYTLPGNGVTATISNDPQVDKVDWYRMTPALENFTYVGTVANQDAGGGITAPFNDNVLSDLDVANNPILQYDNYEPFPGIDLPRSGQVNVSGGVGSVGSTGGSSMTAGTYPLSFSGGGGSGAAGTITVFSDGVSTTTTITASGGGYTGQPTVTATIPVGTNGTLPAFTVNMWNTVHYAGGDPFNPLWLPGTVIQIGPTPSTQTAYTLYSRPFASTPGGSIDSLIAVNLNTDANGLPINVTPPGDSVLTPPQTTQLYSIQEPTLAGTAYPSPVIWGPTPDNVGAYYFGLDPLNPGDLLWSKGNNFDSAPDTNRMYVTSPSETLMNGTVTSELSTVFSTERMWLIRENFADLVASMTGTEGQQWTLTQSAVTRGLYMRYAIDCLGSLLAWRAKDCVCISNGGQSEESITDSIYNLFPHGGQTPIVGSQDTPPTTVTIAGQTIYPPDDTRPDKQTIKITPGYIFYNYQDTKGLARTLCFDIEAKGWSVDAYTPPVTCHLWPVGPNPLQTVPNPTPDPNFMTSAIKPLCGCTDGTVRRLGDGGEAGTSIIATRSENGGDSRAQKRLGDMFIKALVMPSAPVQVSLWQSRFTVPLSGYAPTTLTSTNMVPQPEPVVPGSLNDYIVDFTAGHGADINDVAVLFSWPLGSADILDLWQPDWTELPEVTEDRPTDWDDGGSPGNKFVQGMYMQVDTFGQMKTFQVQADDGSLHTPVECPFSQTPEAIRSFTFNPPFQAHMVRIISTDGVPWRIGPGSGWTLSMIAQPAPESSTTYTTEASTFNLHGYIFCYQINLAYYATAPVSVTLNTDQGTFTLNFPAGGTPTVPAKILVKAPRNKWKICSFTVSSGAPIQIYKSLSEVWLREWGETGEFHKECPLGTDTPPAATI